MMRVGTYSSNSPYKTDNTTSVISNATLDDIWMQHVLVLIVYYFDVASLGFVDLQHECQVFCTLQRYMDCEMKLI
jgi:hypothetical protein